MQDGLARAYMWEHTEKDELGRPGFREWDDDYVVDRISTPSWKVIYETAIRDRAAQGGKDNQAWLFMIDAGGRKYSKPFPASAEEYRKALKEFGG
jgi:hypothetical protein